jgi:hypothetical protein
LSNQVRPLLYRITQIAVREGVTLSLSTLAEWIGRVGVALQPLADRLIWHLLQGRVLHADETPVAQLDPGSGKTQRAYLWVYRSNDFELGPHIVVFDYQTSRSGKHATSSTAGKAISLSTTMPVTNRCSPSAIAPNSAAGRHTRAANSSTCTRPTPAPLHSKHCNASANFIPSKTKASI